MNPKPAETRPSASRRRRWFRVWAIVLGLVPFLFAETLLRLAGWSPPSGTYDPYISFAAIRPLFELDATGERYVIAASRLGYFRPASFAARKAPEEFRVFCLGGSTVQGNPWGPETSFTTWLELSLRAADPARKWKVVNCGGISYASYRLRPILDEILGYQPDLIVLYTGQNEFLEDRTYAELREQPRWLLQLQHAAMRSRLFVWTQTTLGSLRGRPVPTSLPEEVDARLDYQNGLEDYHRDDAWRQSVVRHFGLNLRGMVARCQSAQVPMYLCNPVCNLKDCPPFKYELRPGMTADARQNFLRLWNEARNLSVKEVAQRITLLEEARRLDGQHAGVLFDLGQSYFADRQIEKASESFVQAKDHDVCPLRILEPMHEIILAVAREQRVPLLDVRRQFEALSPDGLTGEEMLVDHVHPTIRGQQKIAELVRAQMERERIVIPAVGWEQRQQDSFRQHLESLDVAYYARGQEHLEGLRRWSQGRAPKRRP